MLGLQDPSYHLTNRERDENQRMKTIHLSIIVVVTVAIVSSVIGYYLFMPAWIYAEKITNLSDMRITDLSDQDLKNVPVLEQIIGLSDAAYPSGHMQPLRTSYLEGKKIADVIHADGDGHGVISYKNNTYSIYLSFTYGSPGFQ
jgi:hypothetical protein